MLKCLACLSSNCFHLLGLFLEERTTDSFAGELWVKAMFNRQVPHSFCSLSFEYGSEISQKEKDHCQFDFHFRRGLVLSVICSIKLLRISETEGRTAG